MSSFLVFWRRKARRREMQGITKGSFCFQLEYCDTLNVDVLLSLSWPCFNVQEISPHGYILLKHTQTQSHFSFDVIVFCLSEFVIQSANPCHNLCIRHTNTLTSHPNRMVNGNMIVRPFPFFLCPSSPHDLAFTEQISFSSITYCRWCVCEIMWECVTG